MDFLAALLILILVVWFTKSLFVALLYIGAALVVLYFIKGHEQEIVTWR